jgi:hypothetical protein
MWPSATLTRFDGRESQTKAIFQYDNRKTSALLAKSRGKLNARHAGCD